MIVNSVIAKLCKVIENESFFLPNQKLLLAVSTGIDSMVMLELFQQLPYRIGVAHINHLIRPEESCKEEIFIRDYCNSRSIPLHLAQKNVPLLTRKLNGNLQDVARKYRYKFLEKCRKSHGYDYIITAHHQGDLIEGFFINLLRGSGLKGLKGILPVNGHLIRPLLNFSKSEIENYAKENDIQFKEDSSNEDLKYHRNFIRHQIIPEFEKLKKGANKSILKSMENLQDIYPLYRAYVEILRSKLCKQTQKGSSIYKRKLLKYPSKQTILYEILSPFGFNRTQVIQILKSADQSGIEFHSKKYILHNSRKKFLIVKKSKEKKRRVFEISSPGKYVIEPGKLLIIEPVQTYELNAESSLEFVDGQNLRFPLNLRSWVKGDRFYPIGMEGKSKKVNKFLTDLKISKHKKREIHILESGEEIVWILGYRLDHRFRIVDETKKIYKLQIIKTKKPAQ